MKSFANVTNLKPNVFILSIDSEDTYFSVSIHLEHQNYLFFFSTNCINSQFNCVSNGCMLLVLNYEKFSQN